MPRVSLRELLLLIAFIALAIVSLKYASAAWQIAIMMLILIVFIVTTITSILERGARQAFAIGVFVALSIYGGSIVVGEFAEFTGGRTSRYSRFPTARLLDYLFVGVRDTQWFDRNTGEVISPEAMDRRTFAQPPRRRVMPDYDEFVTIGHAWWALLLGYLGGRFAKFIYIRRTRENMPLAAGSS